MKYYVVIGTYGRNEKDIIGYFKNIDNAKEALKNANRYNREWKDKVGNVVNFNDYTAEEIINNYIHFFNYYDYHIEEKEIIFND